MKKMSYVAVVNDVLNGVALTDEHIERLTALRDSLAKRNSTKSGKPTKVQLANAEIADTLLGVIESDHDYTIAEIKGLVPALADATPQKVSPICRKLVADGKLVEGKVKGKVVYRLA